MITIEDIHKTDSELLCCLTEAAPCKISVNGKTIFEGFVEDYIENETIDNTIAVCEFKTENKSTLILLEHNIYIEQLKTLFENKQFEDIYNDAKLFNKAMSIANKLPLYNITNESNTSEQNLKGIRKYGTNFQKIYENLYI